MTTPKNNSYVVVHDEYASTFVKGRILSSTRKVLCIEKASTKNTVIVQIHDGLRYEKYTPFPKKLKFKKRFIIWQYGDKYVSEHDSLAEVTNTLREMYNMNSECSLETFMSKFSVSEKLVAVL